MRHTQPTITQILDALYDEHAECCEQIQQVQQELESLQHHLKSLIDKIDFYEFGFFTKASYQRISPLQSKIPL